MRLTSIGLGKSCKVNELCNVKFPVSGVCSSTFIASGYLNIYSLPTLRTCCGPSRRKHGMPLPVLTYCLTSDVAAFDQVLCRRLSACYSTCKSGHGNARFVDIALCVCPGLAAVARLVCADESR